MLRFVIRLRIGAALAAPLCFSGLVGMMADAGQLPVHWTKTSYSMMSGWDEDDHDAAFHAFMRFCKKPDGLNRNNTVLAGIKKNLNAICRTHDESEAGTFDAQRYFEANFTPFEVSEPGFVTGYFEPELPASKVRDGPYQTPLLRAPSGLTKVTGSNRTASWPRDLTHGRFTDGVLKELPDRGAIMDGALENEALELAWLADPVDAFFVHVQGSARLKLTDGTVVRVGYAGKTGHPYTSIGRLLVGSGQGTAEDFTMSGLKAWLERHPERRDDLFRKNRSYIFFREVQDIDPTDGPIGAAGLPLVAGRSLAIDPVHILYGLPVHVSASFPDPGNKEKFFQRLMIADDTGSAIRGPARGDIFVGSGEAAGQAAGEIRHPARFVILVPNNRASAATPQE